MRAENGLLGLVLLQNAWQNLSPVTLGALIGDGPGSGRVTPGGGSWRTVPADVYRLFRRPGAVAQNNHQRLLREQLESADELLRQLSGG
ncbi:hypothetical protein L6R49_29990 [Myxococcota bacterium]|nr:hypothetical protein [Myxococcota bacterium]